VINLIGCQSYLSNGLGEWVGIIVIELPVSGNFRSEMIDKLSLVVIKKSQLVYNKGIKYIK